MLRDIEKVAQASDIRLLDHGSVWTYDDDAPHIRRFEYDVAKLDAELDQLETLGTIDGYRIAQDWTVAHDLRLWDEADALDADVVCYVEALIRESRACERVFDFARDLASIQRITIVRHVESGGESASAQLMQAAVASLAMMDAPILMLVDPWPFAAERGTPQGKLAGRSHIPQLLEIGFVRMVGSRFVWGWNRELSEAIMADYSYDALRAAKDEGTLDEIFGTPLAAASYGPLPEDVASMLGVPDPEDLVDE